MSPTEWQRGPAIDAAKVAIGRFVSGEDIKDVLKDIRKGLKDAEELPDPTPPPTP